MTTKRGKKEWGKGEQMDLPQQLRHSVKQLQRVPVRIWNSQILPLATRNPSKKKEKKRRRRG